jgi:hypothetical protein
MRNELHRRHAAFVLAALVLATAFPMTLTLSRDGGERPDEVIVARVVTKVMADSDAAAAVPNPSFADGSDWTDAAKQTASMMLVGTLLIGIGTVVRRVA